MDPWATPLAFWMAHQFATIQNETANSIYGVGYPASTALPNA
jgi:hypothetical protein